MADNPTSLDRGGKGRHRAAPSCRTAGDAGDAAHLLEGGGSRDRRLDEKYSRLFDLAPMGYLVLSPDGAICEANHTAAVALGLSKTELIGRPATDFIHRDYRDGFDLHTSRCTRQEEPVGFDAVMLRDGGQSFNAHLHIQRDRADEAQDFLTRVAFNDVSEQLQRAARDVAYLSERMLRVQEDEQRRIAAELHDQTGQNLNALKLQLASIYNRLDSRQQGIRNEFLKAQELVSGIIEDIRRVAHGLSPAALDVLGIAAAARELGGEFEEYTGVPVDIDVDDLDRVVKHSARIAVYRILQEALTNIAKHAGASMVRISARHAGDLVALTVADDGCGFETPRLGACEATPRGLGLDAMRLRARMIGAALDLESRPGRGTRIGLKVPLKTVKDADEQL